MPTWQGVRRLTVIPTITTGAGSAPTDFQQRVVDRIFFDPSPPAGIDRSLRGYIHAVSYGRASLEAQVLPPVTVPWAMHGSPPQANPGQTMTDAIAAAGATSAADHPFVMVVFPNGINIRAWAFYGGGEQARSYVLLDNEIGAWAMELLHMVTEFGDLYGPPAGRSPSPGAYDQMDASSGTHPSTFTKLRMGWIDAATVVVHPPLTRARWTLHPLSRLHPPPPGRVCAIRIPIGGATTRYFLIEAREALDDYERATPGLSSGIPRDGVIVYDVDESMWPPLWLRVSHGLQVGETFQTSADTDVRVVDRLPGGGFRIDVGGRRLSVAVTPFPVPMNVPVSVQFTATDLDTGVTVTGDVRKNGAVIGNANVTFTHTFRPTRKRVGSEWELVPPVVTVRASGYPAVTVDCGFEVV